jgi:hypothetical protein
MTNFVIDVLLFSTMLVFVSGIVVAAAHFLI